MRRERPWRHVSAVHRLERSPAQARNEVWSMDFVSGQLAEERRFRTLTIVDIYTRECLDIAVGQNLRATDVVAALEQLRYSRGAPSGFIATTARSSSAGKWICGPMPMASRSTSAVVAN